MILAALIAVVIIQVVTVLGLFWGLVELRAMQKSTHSIQYVPVEPKFENITKDLQDTLGKDIFNNVG